MVWIVNVKVIAVETNSARTLFCFAQRTNARTINTVNNAVTMIKAIHPNLWIMFELKYFGEYDMDDKKLQLNAQNILSLKKASNEYLKKFVFDFGTDCGKLILHGIYLFPLFAFYYKVYNGFSLLFSNIEK